MKAKVGDFLDFCALGNTIGKRKRCLASMLEPDAGSEMSGQQARNVSTSVAHGIGGKRYE
jgi:hypothetical protein